MTNRFHTSPTGWKARYEQMLRDYPDQPFKAERRPMFPMGELEYALAHPTPFQTVTIRPPSDPVAAVHAINAYLEGLDS